MTLNQTAPTRNNVMRKK